MKKSTKRSAFTLIELLIVIAVIGILAAMLFPAIQSVMGSAQGTQVANNGKQIVMAITSANIDRTSNMRGEVWPGKGKWQDSNAYFAKLLGDGASGLLNSVTGGDAAKGAGDAVKSVTEDTKNLLGTAGDGAKAATGTVTDGAKKAADTVTDGAKKATEAIGNLFK